MLLEKAPHAYIDPSASKRVVKKTTHIRCQIWLAIQLPLSIHNERWGVDIFTQTIPANIRILKCSPLIHLDENVFVFSDEIQVNSLVFRQGIRQIS
jgi:hypothetical protein